MFLNLGHTALLLQSLLVSLGFRYTAEIRLYANMQTSNFGNVFLDERQSLPIEQIMSVQVASNTKYEGKRIDIHTCCAHIKYPRLALDNNGQQGVSSQNYKQDYSFRAPSPEVRIEKQMLTYMIEYSPCGTLFTGSQ